ncbi:hypothetical protein [Mangrovimonas spongiae]|uniref:Uncharacterized protein n=1 Tax=Mangrovimonas spongiae TaxID=2494697 RepID=A0A3R9MAV1_9FLAO|nr:hypothetical protein [Mangrovimonas spongiae]RSK41400.1 hypothetical protein EJA19_00570 [Mangrovimonas spongiae]
MKTFCLQLSLVVFKFFKVMKIKTLLELITLSSSIYVLAQDTKFLDKLNELSEKKLADIEHNESSLNENGDRLEPIDKIILKAQALKEELENKIEDAVIKFYKKINVAHLDEIKALNQKIEKLNKSVALLEARLNKIQTS